MNKPITKYSYYLAMKELCKDLAKAYREIDGDKSVDADIFIYASEGFENKMKYMSIEESSRPLSEERYKRLEDFRWFVQGKEQAAQRHKDAANAKDADSAGA